MFCFFAILLIIINRIVFNIKLTPENVNSLVKKNSDGYLCNLANQNIKEIDPVALNAINSTSLELYQNKLEFLQEDLFKHNFKFEVLYFNANEISKIHPRAFQKLLNLTNVTLSHNKLTEIDENLFEGNSKLKTIFLDNNRITFFHPKTFKYLKNLVRLNLMFNQLTSFDMNSLSSAKGLEDLFLNNNNLIEIRYHDLELRFPKLWLATFYHNKFNCSFAQQMEEYVEAHPFILYLKSISCVSDEEYAGIV